MTYYLHEKAIEAKDGWLLYWAPPAEGFDVTPGARCVLFWSARFGAVAAA